MALYIPKQGDIVALSFNPQSGHEQRGKRPAIVISKYQFNKSTGMIMVCPITNTDREIPFHVSITSSQKITGFIMTEQLKSLDYKARKARFIGKSSKNIFNEVLSILDAVIY